MDTRGRNHLGSCMERFTNSLRCSYGVAAMLVCLPIGTKVVHFWGSYLEFYKVFPKRSYFGAYGYWISRTSPKLGYSNSLGLQLLI